MRITDLEIENFKSIRHMEIHDIENALILVGKNNTGKTVVLDAVRLLGGEYVLSGDDFMFPEQNIIIRAGLSLIRRLPGASQPGHCVQI